MYRRFQNRHLPHYSQTHFVWFYHRNVPSERKVESRTDKEAASVAKMQSQVGFTIDCYSTHLYTPGIRQHIKAAAAAGPTLAEVLEVLELSSTLRIHACNIGIPLLLQVMKEENVYDRPPPVGKPFDDQRLALKNDSTAKRGYWHAFWEDFLALDPEFFEAYTEFVSPRHVGSPSNHSSTWI